MNYQNQDTYSLKTSTHISDRMAKIQGSKDYKDKLNDKIINGFDKESVASICDFIHREMLTCFVYVDNADKVTKEKTNKTIKMQDINKSNLTFELTDDEIKNKICHSARLWYESYIGRWIDNKFFISKVKE
jgi:hypothetical protein